MDQVDKIIAYEDESLSSEAIIALLQELVNSGLVWQLEDRYGRTIKALLGANLIVGKKEGI